MTSISICITGWVGDARKEIISLIKLLGAVNSDTLNKDINYLVCKEPSGNKYEKAIKNRWNVKIVSEEWLLACVKEVFNLFYLTNFFLKRVIV